MLSATGAGLTDAVRSAALRLTGAASDWDSLMELIGDARFVLLGAASHGTHEFYHARAEITKRLIQEKGFAAVAVEADWPDAYRVNRFVRGAGETSIEALDGFERSGAWMWRNVDVLDFIGWLREYNDALPAGAPAAGFYGLDLYSLSASIQEVLNYLDRVDPTSAKRARQRYSCLGHVSEKNPLCKDAFGFNFSESCQKELVKQLVELQRRAGEYKQRDSRLAEDEFFYAEQNARLVKNAEQYYRSMFGGRASSWNLREHHMAETLDVLVAHLDRQGRAAKIAVWAHNSHLGDARATEMGDLDEFNVGELVRQRYKGDAVLVGLTANTGTVTAAAGWGGPAGRVRVPPALPDSYEALFHETGIPSFLLPLHDDPIAAGLRPRRMERAIGAVYDPEMELVSNYFYASLSHQFDAVVYFDVARAVEPVETAGESQTDGVPQTFPSSL
ncbi:erythromycin esterase family protein [Kamptonema formosum]|uniref:erythromycin esterase family protein n=1 Tax=Kamptonema formosum TaxID=331992 RepID=UPI000349C7C6|nr:erythromycin esterase family protein [Oscillatoria sp. PCC 10802]